MPRKKNTKSSQIQQIQPEDPVDQILQNVVQDFVDKATSTIPVSPQEIIPLETTPPKKKTRKPRTTKKKELSSQEGSNIIDLNTSPAIKADTQEVTPIKKRPGRKPKVKQQQEAVTVREEPPEQQQQHTTTTSTVAPQHQLLFINATPEEPLKKKPGRKSKAKKQEEAQHQQQPLSEEKPTPAAISTPSPAAIRNLINIDDVSPYAFNKGELKSESQSNSNYNSPSVAPSPVVQPVIAPITAPISTPISAVTPPPVAAQSKRGRPKKAKVDSQTASTSDVTESHDTKPASTRKRKLRKQGVSAELDKSSEIVAGETSAQEQVEQQKQEEVEQPTIAAKAANPTKKRRTKKRDAATIPQIAASIEQTPVQDEQHPPVKTTKRGRPKKIRPNDTVIEKPAVREETVAIKMEEVNDTESKSVIESHVVEPQLQHQKSFVNADSQILSIAKAEQKQFDSAKPSVGPKNSSVVLNEDVEILEYQEREKSSVKSADASENNNNFQSEQDVTMDNARNDEEKIVNSPVGEQSVKRKRPLDNSDNDDEGSDQPIPKKLSRIEERKAKFNKLRSRMDEGESANRKEVYEEHQRKKTNPKEMVRQERKRNEAEKLLAKQQAEERGEDYERSKFWEYSVDAVEKWEKKQEKKAKKSDVAFTDYNQVAHKKYKKQINELKPDLVTYNEQKAAAIASSSLIKTEDGQIVSVDTESSFYRDANSLQYASVDNQPSRESIDKVVADVNKTIAKREKSSRQKTINEDDDITYINERNRRFNEKIGRFYDKYTKEIKENFERGTAL